MEKNNMFEGAKFGDEFVTRDGRTALFYKQEFDSKYTLIIENYVGIYNTFYADGRQDKDYETQIDIVSKYHEEIVEEKLDKLARISTNNSYIKINSISSESSFIEGFKAGYRKAKEEI